MLQVGSVVDGKYTILKEIGHGGMSTVYLAINERANKTWAIKEVRKSGVTNYEVVRQGLIAETNILKRLNHPNLPSIIDVIDADDTFLIVMDYIEGKDLQKRIQESGAQPWRYVVNWAIQLCDVLDYLHTRQPPIIYRDMKPANIVLKPEGEVGRVMLLDFGTAREYKGTGAAQDTTCLGTRGYASPEQYGGQGETDARSDIYTLGATIYHLVTGHMPEEPPYYQMRPIREWDPTLPPGLEAIILKCTQSNKEDRYQNCKELKYALLNVEKQSQDYVRRQRMKLRLFVLCAVLTVVFGAASFACKMGEKYYSTEQYDSLLRQGDNFNSSWPEEGTPDYLSAEEKFLEAIDIQPTKDTAYQSLLKLYQQDGGISSREKSQLDSVYLGLRSNREAYEQFCFDVGELLFFNFWSDSGKETMSFNVDQGRNLAKSYLEVAMQSDSLGDEGRENGESKKRLAGALYSIASSATSDIFSSNANPLTQEYSAEDYWADLTIMDSSTLIQELDGTTGAPYLTLSIYQTILSEIYKNYTGLSRGGVTTSDMLAEIDAIKVGMELLSREYPELDETSQRLYNQIWDRTGKYAAGKDYITMAREQLSVIDEGA